MQSRRSVLGATAGAMLAGCLSGRDQGGDRAGDESSTGGGGTEPAVRTTSPAPTADRSLEAGEWYTPEYDFVDWAISPRELDTRDSFVDTINDQSANLQSGWTLLYVRSKAKLIATEPVETPFPWVGEMFVRSGSKAYTSGSFEHPDYSETVDPDWLAQPDRSDPTPPTRPGEKVDTWYVIKCPAEVAQSPVFFVPPGEETVIAWKF